MYIDSELKRLRDDWGFTPVQLAHIRYVMANYAFAACIDSSVRKEAEMICLDADATRALEMAMGELGVAEASQKNVVGNNQPGIRYSFPQTSN